MADWVVDMGPGAGEHGGQVVAQGDPEAVQRDPASLTGQYLSGARAIAIPQRRPVNDELPWLTLTGATGNNLKNVDLRIPAGRLVCVTGVSGSGKSTLVNDTLAVAVSRQLHHAQSEPARLRGHAGPGALRQDHQRRPEPHRPHAAQQPGHLHGPVHADPRAVRRRAGSARAATIRAASAST